MWRGFSKLPSVSRNLQALAIAILLTALPLSTAAQVRGGAGFRFGGGFHNGGFAGGRSGRFGRNATFWGDPYFYADYPVQSLAYETPPAPVIIVQTGAAGPAAPERVSESVLIEWQGDHYVRSNGERPSNASQDYAESSATPRAQTADADLPPAVLVYRDGHREEVADYVIDHGSLFARGNYYRDGYWTKNIQLASLNIAATLKANEQTGVKFVLPSSPNEVVTRP